MSNANIGSVRTRVIGTESLHPVGWFAVWLVVGVALAFSAVAVLSLGVFVFPFAVAAVVLLIVRHHFDRSAWGLLCGIGLLSLYVAWVQRQGPGTVSWHTATASGTDTWMDPRPWLVAGLLLIVAGVVAFLWRKRGVAEGALRLK